MTNSWTQTLRLPRKEQNQLIRAVLKKAKMRLCVTGPSMAPTVEHGDSIEVQAFSGRATIGSLYLFETTDGRLYAHRLVAIRSSGAETQYVFKGDHLTLVDPAVKASQILGLITAVWRNQMPKPFRVPLSIPVLRHFLVYYFQLKPRLKCLLHRLWSMHAQ